jgi:nitrogen regulatory protein PII
MDLSRVEIITSMAKVTALQEAFGQFGITGMTVMQVMGCGVQLGTQEYEVDKKECPSLLPKQMEFVKKELYTGHIGDGKIFVSPVTNAVRVRTGEEGEEALIEGTL